MLFVTICCLTFCICECVSILQDKAIGIEGPPPPLNRKEKKSRYEKFSTALWILPGIFFSFPTL